MSDEITGMVEEQVAEEVMPDAGAETAVDQSGEISQGSAGQDTVPVKSGERMVPVKAVVTEKGKRQALEDENTALLEELSILRKITGDYPGMTAPRSGRRIEERPAAARPQGKTPFDDLPDDAPITVGEIRPMFDQAIESATGPLVERYEGRIAEMQYFVSELGGKIQYGDEWPIIKQFAAEVLRERPRIQRVLQEQGMNVDPVEGIALLAAMHPKYKESIKTQAVAGVVKNIQSTLEKPGTAMTAVKPSPVSAYEKYKRDRGKMSLDEATRLLDEALSQA